MVCIGYSAISFGDESQLKLFHLEGGIWVDHTISLDTTTNIICASVDSLSPFAIFKPVYIATVQQPLNPDESSVFKANRGVVPVKFRLTLVLRFRNDDQVRLPPRGKDIGQLRGPCDGPRSVRTMSSVWRGPPSTEKGLGFGWTALRTRPTGVGSLPHRQRHGE